MARVTPRLPELLGADPHVVADFHVNELASDKAGSVVPFGDLEFPLPVEQLLYRHPKPANRPHLADGR